MRRTILALAPLLALFAVPVTAQDEVSASRYVSPQQAAVERAAIAAFGPFRVVDAHTVAIVDVTDERSPAEFAALLARYPEVDTLDFVEAPGTHDDRANLALGRMVRAQGLVTRAPDGGSVRSGAVELFLAGVTREIDEGSEFAVHGWLDDLGRGAEDFAPGSPEHRAYLEYYVEMGMAEEEARAFYAMTNSVPFEQALWLTGREMQGWIGGAEPERAPSLAYAVLSL
ncbi:hypothetical protein [Aurantiacibacter luteus]|uniref:Alpha/beta hydrolase n=1 Tax=Aurantiacibacter luteus TaxID=1581420 RepID=A0A0G9MTX6_9SPHN|nr:hypothetical protein [Aurantiacibacter luteus]KLE34044.1 hypothetical protein AAW00_07025 [Aurantiacibacter luteus]